MKISEYLGKMVTTRATVFGVRLKVAFFNARQSKQYDEYHFTDGKRFGENSPVRASID